MHRVSSKRTLTILAFAAIALLVSAAPGAPLDPLSVVPPGAIAVTSAGSPATLAANALAFARASGIKQLEDGIQELLNGLQGQGLPPEAEPLMAALDFQRRLVVAVYPADPDSVDPDGDGEPDIGLMAFLPLKGKLSAGDESALDASISQIAGSGTASVESSRALPGYLVLCVDMAAPEAFPVAETGAARLMDYPASSVALWVDAKSAAAFYELLPSDLRSLMSPSSTTYVPSEESYMSEEEYWSGAADNTGAGGSAADNSGASDEASDEVADEVADDSAYEEPSDDYPEDYDWGEYADGSDGSDSGDAAGAEAGNAALEALGAVFDGVESVDCALIVQTDKVWVRFGAGLVKNSELYAESVRASDSAPSLPYLSYCETDALMSMAWSSKGGFGSGLLKRFYDVVFAGKDVPEGMFDAMEAAEAASGRNGAATVDVELSSELSQAARSGALSGEDGMDILGRGLTLTMSGAYELKDRQAWRDALSASADLTRDPDYQAFIAGSGMSFSVERSVGTMDGLPYDLFAYSYSQPDAGMQEASTALALRMINSFMKPVYVYKGDKAYVGLADPKSLKPLIGRDAALKPLAKDPAFRALRAGAPADTRGVFYLSTKRLARLVLRLLPESQEPLPFNVNKLSGLLGWFDASPGSAGFGFGLGAEDVKAVMSLAQ